MSLKYIVSGNKRGYELLMSSPGLEVNSLPFKKVWRDIRAYISFPDTSTKWYSIEFIEGYKVFSIYSSIYDWGGRSGGYVGLNIFIPVNFVLDRDVGVKTSLDQLMRFFEKNYLDSNFKISQGPINLKAFEKEIQDCFPVKKSFSNEVVQKQADEKMALIPYSHGKSVADYLEDSVRIQFMKYRKVFFLDNALYERDKIYFDKNFEVLKNIPPKRMRYNINFELKGEKSQKDLSHKLLINGKKGNTDLRGYPEGAPIRIRYSEDYFKTIDIQTSGNEIISNGIPPHQVNSKGNNISITLKQTPRTYSIALHFVDRDGQLLDGFIDFNISYNDKKKSHSHSNGETLQLQPGNKIILKNIYKNGYKRIESIELDHSDLSKGTYRVKLSKSKPTPPTSAKPTGKRSKSSPIQEKNGRAESKGKGNKAQPEKKKAVYWKLSGNKKKFVFMIPMFLILLYLATGLFFGSWPFISPKEGSEADENKEEIVDTTATKSDEEQERHPNVDENSDKNSSTLKASLQTELNEIQKFANGLEFGSTEYSTDSIDEKIKRLKEIRDLNPQVSEELDWTSKLKYSNVNMKIEDKDLVKRLEDLNDIVKADYNVRNKKGTKKIDAYCGLLFLYKTRKLSQAQNSAILDRTKVLKEKYIREDSGDPCNKKEE